jgi:hypothetical protein
MGSQHIKPGKIDRALLCLSDSDIGVSLRQPVFGRPLLFHIIKNLQAVGIVDISVAAESIPPELPTLVDQLRAQGISLRLLRNGPEAVGVAAQPGGLLLQNAAIWVARSRLQELVDQDKKLILTLPEDPDFQAFERIDLNRRWAGIALIDGTLAEGLGEMPEGWSMDSFLLRSALQAGYSDRAFVSEKPADDVVIHARAPAAAGLLIKRLQPLPKNNGILERASVRLADAAINRFASEKWWQPAIDAALPFAAMCSAICAFFGYSIASLWLGVLALFAWVLRQRAREVAYLPLAADVITLASIVLLLASLGLNLAALMLPLDAAFLALALCGLAAALHNMRDPGLQAFLSPLVVAIWLAVMASAGFSIIAVKLAILGSISVILWHNLRRQS